MYVRHLGKQLSSHFLKHRYISSRLKHSELSKHLSEGHNLNEDLKIRTLRDKLPSKPMRQFYKDLWYGYFAYKRYNQLEEEM